MKWQEKTWDAIEWNRKTCHAMKSHAMNEWINEWTIEGMKAWMHGWMDRNTNARINAWMNDMKSH